MRFRERRPPARLCIRFSECGGFTRECDSASIVRPCVIEHESCALAIQQVPCVPTCDSACVARHVRSNELRAQPRECAIQQAPRAIQSVPRTRACDSARIVYMRVKISKRRTHACDSANIKRACVIQQASHKRAIQRVSYMRAIQRESRTRFSKRRARLRIIERCARKRV